MDLIKSGVVGCFGDIVIYVFNFVCYMMGELFVDVSCYLWMYEFGCVLDDYGMVVICF